MRGFFQTCGGEWAGCSGQSRSSPRNTKGVASAGVDHRPTCIISHRASAIMGVLTAVSGPSALLVGGVLVLYYIVSVIANYAKLKKFRGPAWTGVSSWPHSMAMLSLNCHKWYAAVNKKYGASGAESDSPAFGPLFVPFGGIFGISGLLASSSWRRAWLPVPGHRSTDELTPLHFQVPLPALRPRCSSPPRPRCGCTSTLSPGTSGPTGTTTRRASSIAATMCLARPTTRNTSSGASRWPRG